jgi:hypothetical protein
MELGKSINTTTPRWMTNSLKLAGIYNLIWGAWVVIFPLHFFQLVGMPDPEPVLIWQGMGMVIGVYGLGYWWASTDPVRHWPIVAVGFLGKIFGPAGFVMNYLTGKVPFDFFYTLITNDFIWWVPFYLMLRKTYLETRFALK